MPDLNSASPHDIADAGLDPLLARTIAFWRPYRCWDDLLRISELDETAIERLRTRGFEIIAPDTSAWSEPKRFRLSNG
ncbi:hypothetical protein [Caulobacter sp. UC70_42]|uniref:hypothetical protein n=1 Tax=Caulobacter sp. UC70_42 TaxID=3374551 RepID=UPI0037567256